MFFKHKINNLKASLFICVFSFLFSFNLIASPATFWDKINNKYRLVSYVDKSGYLNLDAMVLDYDVSSNENSLSNEIYLENIYIEAIGFPDRKSIASFVFHASKDLEETILGAGMYVNSAPFENLNPRIYQAESFSGVVYSTDRKGSDIFVVRFPLKRSIFNYDDPIEYNINIRQLAYFVDIQRPDGSVKRLWVNNNGRDFSHNEIFSELIPLDKSFLNTENKTEKITYKVKTDKPIFDAARHYYCSSFFGQ